MSGLVLKLGPKERLLINGAVVENGDRRSRLTVLTPNANILRLRDAIHPNDANTPVKRACFLSQLLLSGEVDEASVSNQLLHSLRDLQTAFGGGEHHTTVTNAIDALDDGRTYQCLKHLRRLLPIERQLLN